jgi:hypothetical protein
MAERRSLEEALTFSPEKLAFIQGNSTSQPVSVVAEPLHSPVADPVSIESADAESIPIQKPAKTPNSTNAKRTAIGPSPSTESAISQLWVPITTRLQHRTAAALRRAHLEQRLRYAKPDTQQEIIDLAVQQWLEQNGHGQ